MARYVNYIGDLFISKPLPRRFSRLSFSFYHSRAQFISHDLISPVIIHPLVRRDKLFLVDKTKTLDVENVMSSLHNSALVAPTSPSLCLVCPHITSLRIIRCESHQCPGTLCRRSSSIKLNCRNKRCGRGRRSLLPNDSHSRHMSRMSVHIHVKKSACRSIMDLSYERY